MSFPSSLGIVPERLLPSIGKDMMTYIRMQHSREKIMKKKYDCEAYNEKLAVHVMIHKMIINNNGQELYQ